METVIEDAEVYGVYTGELSFQAGSCGRNGYVHNLLNFPSE
jgi:hypothetical protein